MSMMQNKKQTLLYIGAFALLSLAVLYPSVTQAFIGSAANAAIGGVRDALGELLWNFSFVILNLFLYILQFIGTLFEAVAGVQNFFSDGVNAAWEATRDFANLFFALMLLFIAIATVLGMNEYSAKNMLPKFFFAALFINFSKAIVGVLIDISQIIMFEFYNALGGNITNNAVNLSQITYFTEGIPDSVNTWDAYINGTILNLVMIMLIVIMIFAFLWGTLTLAIRLVTLWVLISLSPLAFVSMIVPPLRSAYGQWASTLQQQLVKGPAFMFFVWLSFIILKATTDTLYTPTASLSGQVEGEFSTFFTDGGPFIGFTLTAIFLFMANNIAQQAAESAPGVGKKLGGMVTKYGGIATLGVGGYMGLSNIKGPGQALSTAGKDIVANKGKLAVGAGLATGGLAGAAIGATAVGAGKVAGSVPYVKHRARYAKESLASNWQEGRVIGSRFFSEKAQEKAYQSFKEPLEKARIEEPLLGGKSKFDPKTYLAYRQAETAATKDLKDIDDLDALNDKIIKASDVATKRAGFKQLAKKKGLKDENLKKLADGLGVSFEKDSTRAQKIDKIASQFDFKNPEYATKNMEHRIDAARQLTDDGDFTYNPTEMAKGAEGKDPVVAYLSEKSVSKRMGALNKTNLSKAGQDGKLNEKRFEQIVNSFDESELKRDKLFDDIPNRKELRDMLDQAYPQKNAMPQKVQVFYNSMTQTGSSSKGGGNKNTGASKSKNTSTQPNQNVIDPKDPNNPFNPPQTSVNQTSTGGVDQENMNDNN